MKIIYKKKDENQPSEGVDIQHDNTDSQSTTAIIGSVFENLTVSEYMFSGYLQDFEITSTKKISIISIAAVIIIITVSLVILPKPLLNRTTDRDKHLPSTGKCSNKNSSDCINNTLFQSFETF